MNKIRRFIEGFKKLTPLQLLHAKLVGQCGQVAGMIFAMTALTIMGMWYWLPFMLFTLIILVVDLISILKQYSMMRKIENALGGLQNGGLQRI